MTPNAAIVQGEEELGVQRRCSRCGEAWPMDREFFYRVRGDVRWDSMCRACWIEYNRERRAR